MKAGTRQARDIQGAVNDLMRCIAVHARAVDTLRLLGDPLRGSDYDGTSRSGISDPTPAQAFALTWVHAKQQRIDDKVRAVAFAANDLLVELVSVPSDVDTSSIAAKHRCTGGMGMEGCEVWGDPTCTAIADRDHGHNAGLCSKE